MGYEEEVEQGLRKHFPEGRGTSSENLKKDCWEAARPSYASPFQKEAGLWKRSSGR